MISRICWFPAWQATDLFFASWNINQALICKKTTPNLDFLRLFSQLSNQQLSKTLAWKPVIRTSYKFMWKQKAIPAMCEVTQLKLTRSVVSSHSSQSAQLPASLRHTHVVFQQCAIIIVSFWSHNYTFVYIRVSCRIQVSIFYLKYELLL